MVKKGDARMVEYKVGQKIRVKSLEEIKDFHGENWNDMPGYSQSFLERNAGKVRTIKNIYNYRNIENMEIHIEEDDDDFFIIREIKPYNVISIPKEMFEI